MIDLAHYKHIESAVIHGGIYGDFHTGSVNTPIYQTSTFEQDGLGKPRSNWEYSRTGNPTRAALEALIAELEVGPGDLHFLPVWQPLMQFCISSNPETASLFPTMYMEGLFEFWIKSSSSMA